MERVLGRKLARGESVHHKKGLRVDNRPKNLELWFRGQPAGARVSDLLGYIEIHHRDSIRQVLEFTASASERFLTLDPSDIGS